MRYTKMRDYLSRRSRDMRRGRGGRDRAEYGDMARGRDGTRRMGYFDYNTQDYNDYADYNDYNDYAGRGRDRADYGYDMRRGRDYASNDYRLTPTEIRKWDAELKKMGETYTVDQVRQVAQQHGIRFDEFSPELLTAVANMMHNDFKSVVNGDVGVFVKMAKAFLCDEDFDGEPEEKAYLYYNTIVNKEDE